MASSPGFRCALFREWSNMTLSARLMIGIFAALLLMWQGSSAPAALQLAVYYHRGILADKWHDFVAIAAAMEHAGHTVRTS